jgi:MYXO-CTERM domain-containing protein
LVSRLLKIAAPKVWFVLTLKGSVMNFRQLAAAAALMFGAVAAHANVVTFSQFSLLSPATAVAAVANADDGIVSFSLVGALPLGATLADNPGTDAASLTFYNLSAGTYQLRLETLSGTLSSAVQVTVGGSPISVTAVPEPESYALALAGLGVVGLLARRRRTA